MSKPRYRSLEEALASVPRELRPARDLWPEIASATGLRNGRQGRESAAVNPTPWPLALAASIGVISLAAALAWSVWRAQPAADLVAQQRSGALATQRPVSFEPPQGAAYLAARAALERTFNERLNLLAPATRSRVQADLETIRKANADIRAALAQDPASPLLLQLLRSTWRQEIDLYMNVSQATEPMLMRRT